MSDETQTIEEAWEVALEHLGDGRGPGGCCKRAARALALAVLDEAMEIYSGYDPEFKVDETAAADYMVARARIEALGK